MGDSLGDKLSKMLSGVEDTATKDKLQKMLEMVKEGKTDELLSTLDGKDKEKVQKMMKKFDKKKLDSLGLNLENIQSQINPDTVSELQSKLSKIQPDLAEKMKDLLK